MFVSKPNQENEVEEAVQALEHFVGVNYVSRSTVLEPTLSFPVPDYPNTYWYHTDDPRRQNEKIALIREIVDAMPELEIIYLLYETFVTRCQGPLGNVVHTPTFMKQAENFCGCLALASLEAQVMALSSTVPMDALASLLMAVRMPLSRALILPMLTFPPFTDRARSRLPTHTISTRLVSYTFDSSCGGTSSVRCTFEEMEVTRLTLPPRRRVALFWLDCGFASCYHAFARWPRAIFEYSKS